MSKQRKNKIKIKRKVKKNVNISLSSYSSIPLNTKEIDLNEEERYTRGIEHLTDQNLYNY